MFADRSSKHKTLVCSSWTSITSNGRPRSCSMLAHLDLGRPKPNSVPLVAQLLLLADRLHVLIRTPACPRKQYVEPMLI